MKVFMSLFATATIGLLLAFARQPDRGEVDEVSNTPTRQESSRIGVHGDTALVAASLRILHDTDGRPHFTLEIDAPTGSALVYTTELVSVSGLYIAEPTPTHIPQVTGVGTNAVDVQLPLALSPGFLVLRARVIVEPPDGDTYVEEPEIFLHVSEDGSVDVLDVNDWFEQAGAYTVGAD